MIFWGFSCWIFVLQMGNPWVTRDDLPCSGWQYLITSISSKRIEVSSWISWWSRCVSSIHPYFLVKRRIGCKSYKEIDRVVEGCSVDIVPCGRWFFRTKHAMTIHVTSRRVTANGGLAREATVLRNDFTSVLKLVEYARKRLDRANRNDILKTQQTLSYIYICYPPPQRSTFFVIFAFAESIGRLTEKKSSGHGTEERRTGVSASTRVRQSWRERYVRGLTCDLVRRSTRTILEVSLQAWY